MSDPAELLLSRLEAVRQTGPGRWLTRCPSHEDRRPSLSVREVDDGRVLVYCFAGCGAADVVAAVGLDLCDLFPPSKAWRPGNGGPRETAGRRASRIPAADALRVLEQESIVVEIIAADLAAGNRLDEAGVEALETAGARISQVQRAWAMSR